MLKVYWLNIPITLTTLSCNVIYNRIRLHFYKETHGAYSRYAPCVKNGRELSRITRGSKIWDFTYDMAGVRSGKTVTTTDASTGETPTTHYEYITLSGKLTRLEQQK